jgi:hypothetical protein
MKKSNSMKEMILKEIQSIPAIEERILFKNLMEEVFLELYEKNEQMYEELEKRVQDELAYDVNRYRIRTGVIEKQFFDVSHHLMFPMEGSDVQKKSYNATDIAQALEEDGEFVLMKVLLHCDYQQIQKIWNSEIEFEGILQTDKPEKDWKITVRLRQNMDYLKKIGQLYQLFIKNGIPWQTVNAPYLYKMADVVLTHLPEAIPKTEIIQKVEIQFREYQPLICYNIIPIWNVCKLNLESVGFPVPCEEHKNFEHNISIQKYGTQHAYLAEDDLDIQSISQRKDRLLITSKVSDAKKWNIYMIRNVEDSKIDRYLYPLMENERKETFTEKFQRKWEQRVKTKAELSRFIRGFGMENYVIYQDCAIADEFEKEKETYSMNPFIEDEMRDYQAQKKLILYFIPGPEEAWLQRDIASFLVSEVQRLYPEYECGGIMR